MSLTPEGLNTAQQIVALDTKYNSFRPLPNQHRKDSVASISPTLCNSCVTLASM